MIVYKDKTFCAMFGVCANTKCHHWLNYEEYEKQDLPVSLDDLKSDTCGFIPNPVYQKLLGITGHDTTP